MPSPIGDSPGKVEHGKCGPIRDRYASAMSMRAATVESVETLFRQCAAASSGPTVATRTCYHALLTDILTALTQQKAVVEMLEHRLTTAWSAALVDEHAVIAKHTMLVMALLLFSSADCAATAEAIVTRVLVRHPPSISAIDCVLAIATHPATQSRPSVASSVPERQRQRRQRAEAEAAHGPTRLFRSLADVAAYRKRTAHLERIVMDRDAARGRRRRCPRPRFSIAFLRRPRDLNSALRPLLQALDALPLPTRCLGCTGRARAFRLLHALGRRRLRRLGLSRETQCLLIMATRPKYPSKQKWDTLSPRKRNFWRRCVFKPLHAILRSCPSVTIREPWRRVARLHHDDRDQRVVCHRGATSTAALAGRFWSCLAGEQMPRLLCVNMLQRVREFGGTREGWLSALAMDEAREPAAAQMVLRALPHLIACGMPPAASDDEPTTTAVAATQAQPREPPPDHDEAPFSVWRRLRRMWYSSDRSQGPGTRRVRASLLRSARSLERVLHRLHREAAPSRPKGAQSPATILARGVRSNVITRPLLLRALRCLDEAFGPTRMHWLLRCAAARAPPPTRGIARRMWIPCVRTWAAFPPTLARGGSLAYDDRRYVLAADGTLLARDFHRDLVRSYRHLLLSLLVLHGKASGPCSPCRALVPRSPIVLTGLRCHLRASSAYHSWFVAWMKKTRPVVQIDVHSPSGEAITSFRTSSRDGAAMRGLQLDLRGFLPFRPMLQVSVSVRFSSFAVGPSASTRWFSFLRGRLCVWGTALGAASPAVPMFDKYRSGLPTMTFRLVAHPLHGAPPPPPPSVDALRDIVDGATTAAPGRREGYTVVQVCVAGFWRRHRMHVNWWRRFPWYTPPARLEEAATVDAAHVLACSTVREATHTTFEGLKLLTPPAIARTSGSAVPEPLSRLGPKSNSRSHAPPTSVYGRSRRRRTWWPRHPSEPPWLHLVRSSPGSPILLRLRCLGRQSLNAYSVFADPGTSRFVAYDATESAWVMRDPRYANAPIVARLTVHGHGPDAEKQPSIPLPRPPRCRRRATTIRSAGHDDDPLGRFARQVNVELVYTRMTTATATATAKAIETDVHPLVVMAFPATLASSSCSVLAFRKAIRLTRMMRFLTKSSTLLPLEAEPHTTWQSTLAFRVKKCRKLDLVYRLRLHVASAPPRPSKRNFGPERASTSFALWSSAIRNRAGRSIARPRRPADDDAEGLDSDSDSGMMLLVTSVAARVSRRDFTSETLGLTAAWLPPRYRLRLRVGGGHDRVGGGTTNNASDDDDEVCQYSFVRATPAHDEGNPLRCGTRCGSTSHPSWTANARTAPNAVLWQDFDFPRTPLVTRAEQIHLALRKWLRTETD